MVRREEVNTIDQARKKGTANTRKLLRRTEEHGAYLPHKHVLRSGFLCAHLCTVQTHDKQSILYAAETLPVNLANLAKVRAKPSPYISVLGRQYPNTS